MAEPEITDVTCGACGTVFPAEPTLIDAAERPDLLAALRDGTLPQPQCPQCNTAYRGEWPLLIHDASRKLVLFSAGDPDAGEQQVRELVQQAIYALMERLPDSHDRPYLGDVEVFLSRQGLRRALQRADRAAALRGSQQPAASSQQPQIEDPAPNRDVVLAAGFGSQKQNAAPTPNIMPGGAVLGLSDEAYQALIGSDGADSLLAAIRQHPSLLDPWADDDIAIRAEAALDEGNEFAAERAELRRVSLAELRAALLDSEMLRPGLQTLLRATDDETLAALIDAQPALLSHEAAALLARAAEQARERGNLRLATRADQLLDALREVRAGLET